MILKVRFLRGEGMINFDYTLLLQFANLLVLLILLNFLLFKPVLRAIDMREGRISSAHNKADTLRQEAAELAETYEEMAKEKKTPILEQKDAILSETHAISTDIIEKARTEAIEELTEVKGQIERDFREVSEALKRDVDRLASQVVQTILKRDVL